MNQPVMPYKFPAALAALLLTACNAQPAEEPPLAGAALGGDFTLTGEDNSQVSWSDFAGKYRIVYFGYAFCPDVCPTDVQRAMAGLKQFEASEPELGAQIQPLFVTIDPDRDTPQVVAEFTDAFHPRLIGLTGSPEEVKAAADKFAVYYARGADSEAGGYLMDHSNITYLFGPAGDPIAMLPTDEGPDAVAAELAKWVR
ncbi:SCO family protein [Qipengyuania nanhaisediminis]|uniref:Protein SCO1/2 n=1 Tax=Qipengyuania nanhaisediminis TaxID=604088 RepID=A0A1I5NFL8_9SPHN|nr:SCO family protein [Qipengyuania nanhaisediminis]SFP20598.1 protein SCO1/2 [Qipengyuania nanhaisediminis]